MLTKQDKKKYNFQHSKYSSSKATTEVVEHNKRPTSEKTRHKN